MSKTKEKSFFKGFEYRIYPNKEQQEYLAKVFGSCRFVYNKLLSDASESYEEYKLLKASDPKLKHKYGMSGYDFAKRMTLIRNDTEYPWLLELPQRPLMNTCHDLGSAFKKFFKEKKGYPRFKSKRGKQSFTLEMGTGGNFSIENGFLRLPKLKSLIKIKLSRDIPEDIRELTVTKTPSGKYFISVLSKVQPKRTSGKGIVGVDLGITTLATLSTGEKLDNPRHYIKHQKRLRILQRRLSKKKKGSSNRNKARIKVAKLHEKIANIRKDYMHKLTTRLICENQAIGIETLRVSGMVRNKHLSKHICDASFGMFSGMLRYKAHHSQHTVIVAADAFYASSKTCSNCNTVMEVKLKLSTRNWTCSHCHSHHDRDTNAAKNLELMAKVYNASTKDRGVTILAAKKFI